MSAKAEGRPRRGDDLGAPFGFDALVMCTSSGQAWRCLAERRREGKSRNILGMFQGSPTLRSAGRAVPRDADSVVQFVQVPVAPDPLGVSSHSAADRGVT